MVSTYIRRPVYRKSPNGLRYCLKCDAEHPVAEFVKLWDQSCNRWPKLRRGRPKKAQPVKPVLMHPEMRRWVCARG